MKVDLLQSVMDCDIVRSIFCMWITDPIRKTSLMCVVNIYISIQNMYSVFISSTDFVNLGNISKWKRANFL